jgi:hypothetical protein
MIAGRGNNKKIFVYDVSVTSLPPPGLPKGTKLLPKDVSNKALRRETWLKFMEVYRKEDAEVLAAYDGQSLAYVVEPGLKEIGPQKVRVGVSAKRPI